MTNNYVVFKNLTVLECLVRIRDKYYASGGVNTYPTRTGHSF